MRAQDLQSPSRRSFSEGIFHGSIYPTAPIKTSDVYPHLRGLLVYPSGRDAVFGRLTPRRGSRTADTRSPCMIQGSDVRCGITGIRCKSPLICSHSVHLCRCSRVAKGGRLKISSLEVHRFKSCHRHHPFSKSIYPILWIDVLLAMADPGLISATYDLL